MRAAVKFKPGDRIVSYSYASQRAGEAVFVRYDEDENFIWITTDHRTDPFKSLNVWSLQEGPQQHPDEPSV